MTDTVARLHGEQLTLAYGKKIIAESLNVTIPDGHFTAIIGPNGCGKSTLLRTLSRLMTPTHGHVYLDGEEIQHYASKEVARRIGLLAQNATTPGDISVQELVARGPIRISRCLAAGVRKMKTRCKMPCWRPALSIWRTRA